MKKNTFNTIVPIDCHGYRIDKFLQLQINKLSRTRLQTLIHDGQVTLNEVIIYSPAKKIKNKDKIFLITIYISLISNNNDDKKKTLHVFTHGSFNFLIKFLLI